MSDSKYKAMELFNESVSKEVLDTITGSNTDRIHCETIGPRWGHDNFPSLHAQKIVSKFQEIPA